MYTGFYSVCPVLISGKNGLAESSQKTSEKSPEALDYTIKIMVHREEPAANYSPTVLVNHSENIFVLSR